MFRLIYNSAGVKASTPIYGVPVENRSEWSEEERWASLGEEIEASLADDDSVTALADDIARAEHATVTLAARLHASGEVTLHVPPALVVRGRVLHVGPDVVVVAEPEAVAAVPLASIALVDGLAPALAWTPTTAAEKIGLAAVLRGWTDRRVVVHLSIGGAVAGEIARVGADHIDVVPDEPFAGLRIGRAIPFTVVAAAVDRSGLPF